MTAWGPWAYSGGNGMRVGWDISGTPVDTNSATYTAHVWVYIQNQYFYSGDAQTVTFAGWVNNSTNYNNSAGGGAVQLVAERDFVFTYATWGASPGTMTTTATISGAYNGVTPSVQIDAPVPARPYAPPNAPFNVTATRNSDAQATVAWADNGNAQGPWHTVSVEYSMYTGSTWSPAWSYVGAVNGVTFSAIMGFLIPNRMYYFRVRANNTSGSSAWAYPPTYVKTTPAAPTGVTASLGPAGTTIPMSWTSQHYMDASNTITIERSVAGGAYSGVASGLAHTTTTWTDPAPGAGTNQYRVKVVQATGSLSSAWATSNVVATVVAPNAPTQLAPNGVPVDVEYVGATLTWLHNPGGDAAAQTHYTIEKSSNGGGTWTALASATNVASSVSSHTVAAGVLTNGATWLWKVKTQGGTTAGFGPFSAAATINGETTPTATLTAPTDPLVSLPLTVTWLYQQDEAIAQAAWIANLYAADGVTLLEQITGSGTGTTATFAYPVADGTTYVVAVRVQSGSGMWSNWATFETTVDLPPPAPAHIDATYDPCTGVMVLSLWAEAPGAGEVIVDYVTVERRVAGGEWVVIAREIEVPTTILDMLPLTNGANEYRITSISTTPSTLVNPIVTVAGTDGGAGSPLWVFVSYGPGFSRVLRVRGDLDIQDKPGRVQALQPFLGRRKPVLLTGIGVTRQVSVSGSLRWADPCPPADACRYDSPPADWLDVAWNGGLVAYRDFTGRRFFASIELQVTDGWWRGNASLSMTLNESDYVELGGVLVP